MILVDTKVLVAAAGSADTNHVAAARLLREVDDRLLLSPLVVAETCYLLHALGGPAPEVRFLRSIAAGDFELGVLGAVDAGRMADLVERYADLGLGGTDASVVALAERLASPRSRRSTAGTSPWSGRRTSRRSTCSRSRRPTVAGDHEVTTGQPRTPLRASLFTYRVIC